MSWFKGDDKLHGHPKARSAGLAAMGLWVLCGTYSADYGLDGHVPPEFVASWPSGKRLAEKLVEVGLWHRLPYTGKCRCILPTVDVKKPGYVFHDWTDCNPSAADIDTARLAAAERQRAHRGRKRQEALPEGEE